MTTLHTQPYPIPAASLGPENPLPIFRHPDENRTAHCDSSVPEDDLRYMGWQTGYRVLPYRMQDGYDRNRRPHTFQSVVLENEILRATVLPEVGGRLVSLFHKGANRELLSRNPVFQPANLALRNAWFSGGIEWNTPHFGHHYLTCSPVFAAKVTGPGGSPVLRLYEWDRTKGVPWAVDLHLPPGSPFLFAHIQVHNPHDHEIPMYWWTNIAVPETEGTRVLAPGPAALVCSPKGLSLGELPSPFGQDITYPTGFKTAQEFFFHVEDCGRPWVAALEEDGAGFVQCSTSRLWGRKMFCWGTGPGGCRWQEYLAEPGEAYLEIQAGLARTQFESLPMPAREHWSWTEAFGLLEASPAEVHSKDWTIARKAVSSTLDAHLPTATLETIHAELLLVASGPPDEILAEGSGWGALERMRLVHEGMEDPIPPTFSFPPESLHFDQEPWIGLLWNGALPEPDTAEDPGHWMVQKEWRLLLDRSLSEGRGDHWLAWLHLGVMRMESGDLEGSRDAWNRSLAHRRTGWALRNLSVLEGREGDPDAAIQRLKEAWEAGPQIAALAIETVRLLVDGARHDELRSFLDSLPPAIRQHERILLLSAASNLQQGRWQDVEPIFDHEIASIQEGEVTLTNLWFTVQEQKLAAIEGRPIDDQIRERVRKEFPPPGKIDFRA